MTAPSIDRLPRARRIHWVRSGSDLTVGYLDGSYVGCIDRVRDGFVAVNAHGEPLGRFDELALAKAALASERRMVVRRGSRDHFDRVAFAAATATGAVSILFAVTFGVVAGF
jgi:hypothetical protein